MNIPKIKNCKHWSHTCSTTKIMMNSGVFYSAKGVFLGKRHIPHFCDLQMVLCSCWELDDGDRSQPKGNFSMKYPQQTVLSTFKSLISLILRSGSELFFGNQSTSRFQGCDMFMNNVSMSQTCLYNISYKKATHIYTPSSRYKGHSAICSLAQNYFAIVCSWVTVVSCLVEYDYKLQLTSLLRW